MINDEDLVPLPEDKLNEIAELDDGALDVVTAYRLSNKIDDLIKSFDSQGKCKMDG